MTGGGPLALLERYVARGTEGLSTGDASLVRRCHAFTLIGQVGAAYSIPFHLVILGLRPLGYTLVALDVVSLVVFTLGRIWLLGAPGARRARMVGHLLAVTALVFIAIPTLASGFGNSPIVSYLAVVPFVAVYILGWRAGVAWALVAAGSLVAVHLLDGRLPVNDPGEFPLLQAQLSLLFIVTTFAAATRRVTDRQLSTIDELAAELQVHNARLARRSMRLEEEVDRAVADSRSHQARFEAGFETSPIGLALVAPSGSFQRVNAALCDMLGYDEVELLARTLAEVTHAADVAADLDSERSLVAGERTTYATDKRYLHQDGSVVWCRLHVAALVGTDGEVDSMFAQVEDITAARTANDELAYRATHDSLTGLANRNRLLDVLTARIDPDPAAGVSVLFVDIDQFKIINDALGHSTGDQLLSAIAGRFGAEIDALLVARLGGDEFALVVERAQAVDAAAAVQSVLHRPFALSGQEVSVTASIGIASVAPLHPTSAEDLLRHADAAMYRAKEEGRATTRVFDDSMRAGLDDRYALARGLSTALDGGEMRVHFQPEIDLRSGTIVGVEALLRWQHPERGLIAAAAFIDLAEETGLIVAMGRWAVGQALEQAKRWSIDGDEPLLTRVNLSANQLAQGDLVPSIAAQIDASGVSPGRLCFEITESAMVETGRAAMANIDALRDLGVHLAIDDFGTGYSSLTYLKKLPADVLKIDQSFVRGMVTDERDRHIVATVIDLADKLGFETVAEGVETEEQATLLREMGCERAQGYLWHRPMPADDVMALLSPVP